MHFIKEKGNSHVLVTSDINHGVIAMKASIFVMLKTNFTFACNHRETE